MYQSIFEKKRTWLYFHQKRGNVNTRETIVKNEKKILSTYAKPSLFLTIHCRKNCQLDIKFFG